MVTGALLWIIPPVIYYFLVRFMRKNVEIPEIKRVWYLVTIPMLIPILGLIACVVAILIFIGCLADRQIVFKSDTKFAKKWLT